jgi:hypothetical protein
MRPKIGVGVFFSSIKQRSGSTASGVAHESREGQMPSLDTRAGEFYLEATLVEHLLAGAYNL